jgi:tellurite resistance protein TehA-like permease
MFISVGPSGFTITGLINMGQNLPRVVGPDFMGKGLGSLAGQVSLICANWAGIWLWGLALWFFIVSVGAHWSTARHGKLNFAMTWYSFIFPNTALTTATFAVATALGDNHPIRIFGCVLTVCLIIMWCFVVAMMIRAVVLKQILWPQKQEDREEGGWKKEMVKDSETDSRSLRKWSISSRARQRVLHGPRDKRSNTTGRDGPNMANAS